MTYSIDTPLPRHYEIVLDHAAEAELYPPLQDNELRTLGSLAVFEAVDLKDESEIERRMDIIMAELRASSIDLRLARADQLDTETRTVLEQERNVIERNLTLWGILQATRDELSGHTTAQPHQYVDPIMLLMERKDAANSDQYSIQAIDDSLKDLALNDEAMADIMGQDEFKERVNKACWHLGKNPETAGQSVDLRSRYIMSTLARFLNGNDERSIWRKKIQEFHTNPFWRQVNDLTQLRIADMCAAEGKVVAFPAIEVDGAAGEDRTYVLFEMNGKRICQTLRYGQHGKLYEVLYSGAMAENQTAQA